MEGQEGEGRDGEERAGEEWRGRGGKGKKGKGREGRKEGVSTPNKNPGYGPGLTALLEKLRLLQIRVAHFCTVSRRHEVQQQQQQHPLIPLSSGVDSTLDT